MEILRKSPKTVNNALQRYKSLVDHTVGSEDSVFLTKHLHLLGEKRLFLEHITGDEDKIPANMQHNNFIEDCYQNRVSF